MEGYARWIVRPSVAQAVVWATLVAAAVAAGLAIQVEQDDNVLAFLPEGDSAVVAFHEIGKKFGGLDVALVGIEAPDVLEADVLGRLQKLTRRLEQSPRVDLVLSLANVEDFRPEPGGGIRAEHLVSDLPERRSGREALRRKIAARDMVVGQLVSHDFSALLVYVFAQPGVDPRSFADDVRSRVNTLFTAERTYFGGAPFVSTYIYEITQDDLRALTPWAVLVVVLLVVFAFRDLYGAALALASTGLGIVFCLGLMAVVGARTNIVLSSLPVILFSVGSAYGIHILARYYALAEDAEHEALENAVASTGPTVLAAGLTTVAGLMSFLAMDVAPLRTFGLFTAIGIFATLVLALAFVPAVVVVFELRPRRAGALRLFEAFAPVVSWSARNRGAASAGMMIIAISGLVYASRVEARMDQTAFFGPGSEPARADRFLLTHFGGSVFLQVELKGDFTDPPALAELARLADRITLDPRVAAVRHIGQVLEQMNAAFQGERRLPDDAAKVRLLYGFLAGRPAVGQLVTAARDRALIHVLLSTTDAEGIEAVVDEVEGLVSRGLVGRYRVLPPDDAGSQRARIDQVLVRLRVLALRYGRGLDASTAEAIVDILARSPETGPPETGPPETGPPGAGPPGTGTRGDRVSRIEAYLRSQEAVIDLRPAPDKLEAVARAAASVGPEAGLTELGTALTEAFGEDASWEGEPASIVAEDLALSLEPLLRALRRRQIAETRASNLAPLVVDVPRARVIDAVIGLETQPVAVSARGRVGGEEAGEVGELAARVSGLPVLHRAMSRSAQRNQVLSLMLALALVVIVLSVLFRSLRVGVVAAVPTLLTLLVIYGGMGKMGVHLDIGTSMLASLIIGAGVDYAVHFVAAWRASGGASVGRMAALETAPAIWTNALMVAGGFFLLTLGEARTLENVGSLTAAAMLTAAFATFVAVPALLGRPLPVDEPMKQAELTEERT